MTTFVITPENKDQLKAISSFLKLVNIPAKTYTNEQKEDLAMFKLMEEEKESPILNNEEKLDFENWLRQ
ncbi:MAG: hypothetical protein ACOVO2_02315 [Emticicia sp.]|uniref:hypothetical protein n=1 Tax=Emticicia sp. TaxID=1930953 RepID=UPI003BA6C8C3